MNEVICRQEMGGGLFLHMIYEPVQELVRCKDCKYKSFYCTEATDGTTLYECHHPCANSVPRPGYWFCADGEHMDKYCVDCDNYDREEQECVYLQVKRDEDSKACDNWEERS